jgi:transmembrane sensor
METHSSGQTGDVGTLSNIDEQAITWLVRLTSGETVAEDRAAFAHWRTLSPAHEAAFVRARQLWVGVGVALPLPPPARVHRIGIPRAYLAAAATVLVVAALTFQYLHVWRYDHVTAPGQRESFTLADGSRVELDGGSALDIRFAHGARAVVLARGEAFFEVVHDPHHSFTVAAGPGRIRDVGTAFGVRLDGHDHVTVTVVRGSVEVNEGSADARLAHDRRLAYGIEGLGAVEEVNAGQALAWTHGRLVLENLPLSAVLAELDRHTSQRIVFFGDRKAGDRRVSAAIDLGHVDDWLDALRSSQDLHIARLPGVVVVY